MRRIIGWTAALVLSAGAAQAFVADNKLLVVPGPGGDFTVPWRGVSDTRAFWCAAADYAQSALGASGQTRIYRTTGRRASGEGMSFSLSPDGAQPTGIFMFQSDGPGLSVAHARMYCRIPPLR